MRGSFSAEWLKVSRNPYLWTVAGSMVTLIVLRDYTLTHLFWVLPGSSGGGSQAASTPTFTQLAVGDPAGLTGALEFIVGVLVMGSEYSWGTLRTVLTCRPSRLQFLAGKLAVMGLTVVSLVAIRYLAAAAASYGLAAAGSGAWHRPQPQEVALSFLAACLVGCTYATFGACLAIAFRRAATAYGVGLTYLFVIEDRALGALSGAGGHAFWTLWGLLPGPNASALVRWFGGSPTGPSLAFSQPAPLHAAGLLVLYAATALLLSGLLLQRRDIS